MEEEMKTPRLNGRHITAMVTAVCIAVVLAPVSVLATSSASRVYITDPSNAAYRAHVSAAGNLSVTAAPGLPGTPFTRLAVGPSPISFTIPKGKHLVIETVSVNVDVTSGNSIYAQVDYTTGGIGGNVFLPLAYSYTESGYDTYVATASVRVYADPGSTVRLSTSSPTGSTGTDFLSVSGYLV